MRLHCLSLLLLPFLILPATAGQDDGADPKAVNAAIEKGVKYLESRYPQHKIMNAQYSELILLTLIHAGVPQKHPLILHNFSRVTGKPLSQVYNAGLCALLLEKVNRKAYQPSLAHIGLFFINSQCQNGQWNYGGRTVRISPLRYAPVKSSDDKNAPPGTTRTSNEGPPPGKEIKIPPPAKKSIITSGDNSNTQYAILGLFAASRAAVVVPEHTWEQVETWFEACQNSDGGWGYAKDDKNKTSTGSMTTAALTGLIVSKFYLGKDWKNENSVKKGLSWLGGRFAVDKNPGGAAQWHYYYLYGLERVGTISGLKKIGNHDWYRKGAEYLLQNQKADGSWKGEVGNNSHEHNILDTCFAILFLRRATPELEKPKDVATGDTGGKTPKQHP